MGKRTTDIVIKEIVTGLSSFELFSLFRDRKHCFFLDSGMDPQKLGRYSFIGFDPELTLTAKAGVDAFAEVKALLEKYQLDYAGELPFIGGAVGYFGYELRHQVERLPKEARDDVQIPDSFFGIYDGAIVVDHLLGKVHLASPGFFGDPEKWVAEVEKAITAAEGMHFPAQILELANEARPKLTANMTKAYYLAAIARIKEYIRSGDIYQVNMTQRFQCRTEASPYELYTRLRKINPAPFAAYIDFGMGQLLSSSPERFLQIRNGKVQTRPIKGTRPRGATELEDSANRQELLESEKDRAELLMIVDLMRNDLGRVCKTGSVKVTEMYHIEDYSTVFQLVSTVEGELEEGIHALDCIKAAFPGGSITGAPKIRAMEIINELEPERRGPYAGAVGYFDFRGNMDTCITIRTFSIDGDEVTIQTGAGIVADSVPETEYQEIRHKAKVLFQVLGGN